MPGDTNQTSDVFLLDRESDVVDRISVTRDGTESVGNAYEGDVTDDGRIAVFSSDAWDLVPGDDNFLNDIFVLDLEAGITERVTVSTSGGDSNAASWGGMLSADGRHVAFYSDASN